jgi:predicted lipoprotein
MRTIAEADLVKPEHLKIGAIGVGATVLAIGLYFEFRPKADERDQFAAEETACLASIAPQFQQLQEAQLAQQTAEMQQAITAYAQNKSRPNLEATMALIDYKYKLTKVKMNNPIL